jgi:ATP phosphoribosyltransferase regulatory subunit
MSAWVLPDHIADVLPSEARHIEEIRRNLLDMARCYGYELVMPPLLEHLESLLSGTAQELDIHTFKLVDQVSGRMIGVRADTTPQVARIDAHLLNRAGVTRLCYCGPVLHTLAHGAYATREPLQFGAEIYGHAGIEADLEILLLALDVFKSVNTSNITVDLADARIVNILLAAADLPLSQRRLIQSALANKDSNELVYLTRDCSRPIAQGLLHLVRLYGDCSILHEARKILPSLHGIDGALSELSWLASQVKNASVRFDLADLQGYTYYTGIRFSLYVDGMNNALARGGRYDEVGSVFGRKRPAVGFSLDVKALASATELPPLRAAVRAPWGEALDLRQAIQSLRATGETVVCVLPGHESEIDEFQCDRELVLIDGKWSVQFI